MGLFDWFRRRRTAPPPLPDLPQPGGFVVVDVETTGLVPARDRIVEIAAVRTDESGRIVDEWVTLLNPEGPVGASHIHGITAADVRRAPRFREVVGELNTRLAGRALVAHNATFDLAFVATEYARAGATFPSAPYLCTLQASWTYLPDVARRRLADLCWVCGIPLHETHSALGDARATAHLLAHYLDPRRSRPRHEHISLPAAATRVRWPDLPSQTVRPVRRPTHTTAPAPAPVGTLWRLLDDLPLATVVDEGAPPSSQPYLELLFEALEDGVLTKEEAGALAEVARLYSLTREQVQATHRAFLLALAHRIVEDGRVTHEERRELTEACDVLGFAGNLPRQILDEATAARQASLATTRGPLPETWNHGAPLHIGEGVAFTGCDPLHRARLEGRALAAGLRVTGSVSGRTAVLVADGADPGTTKAVAARRLGTRVVTPEVFAILVTHVQPPESAPPPPATDAGAAGPAAAPQTVPTPRPSPAEDPATVRAWARERGLQVGVRGRVPATVLTAYRAATEVGATSQAAFVE